MCYLLNKKQLFSNLDSSLHSMYRSKYGIQSVNPTFLQSLLLWQINQQIMEINQIFFFCQGWLIADIWNYYKVVVFFINFVYWQFGQKENINTDNLKNTDYRIQLSGRLIISLSTTNNKIIKCKNHTFTTENIIHQVFIVTFSDNLFSEQRYSKQQIVFCLISERQVALY